MNEVRHECEKPLRFSISKENICCLCIICIQNPTLFWCVCKNKLCLKFTDGLVPQRLSVQSEQTAACQTAVPAAGLGPLLTVSDGTLKLLTHICWQVLARHCEAKSFVPTTWWLPSHLGYLSSCTPHLTTLQVLLLLGFFCSFFFFVAMV